MCAKKILYKREKLISGEKNHLTSISHHELQSLLSCPQDLSISFQLLGSEVLVQHENKEGTAVFSFPDTHMLNKIVLLLDTKKMASEFQALHRSPGNGKLSFRVKEPQLYWGALPMSPKTAVLQTNLTVTRPDFENQSDLEFQDREFVYDRIYHWMYLWWIQVWNLNMKPL